MDLAKEVTTAEAYSWTQGSWTLTGGLPEAKKEDELPFHVVAYDFGAKRNILRMLVDRGCRLTIVPAQTSAEDVLKMNPDGIFLSNGPGDPAPCDYAITAIQKFLETDIPVFGICLGHQLLALASGAKTVKMKFGHHGGNHPVKDVEKNVVMITARTTVLRWMKQHYLQTCVSRINSCSTVRYRAFIAPINRRSASRVTLKPALVHTTPRRCSTTLSS